MARASHWLALVGLTLVGSRVASADDRDKKLASYEAEVTQLVANVPQPNVNMQQPPARRLVDGEVAFSMGSYDEAALLLLDLANAPGSDQETARFYLAETLLAKKERGAARKYFQAIVDSDNTASKYYQPSLLRIIEIAIAHGDLSDIATSTDKLSRLGTSQSAESIYVRAKLAYAQANYDQAIQLFAQVPATAPHALAAQYYTAVVQVAKKDLGAATTTFTAVIAAKPESSADRRIIELSQLGLGRVYYERDQLTKSIDSYLLVDRHSELFRDALYEIAWVYVKTKQYDKALRALELLALAQPDSTQNSTVAILEGNLRIRKAQILRQAIIDGSSRISGGKDPEDAVEDEYLKAEKIFTDTHATYNPSYVALTELSDGGTDASQYLGQIAGRMPEVFQTTAPLPDEAAKYLAEEPGVQRAVRIEGDLEEVRAAITQSEAAVARLDALLAAGDRTVLYPSIQVRRAQVGRLMDRVDQTRAELADEQARLLGGASSSLTASRKTLQQQYAASTGVESTYVTTAQTTGTALDTLEDQIGEVTSALDTTEAMAVSVRTYSKAMDAESETALTAEQTTSVNETLTATQTEAAAINDELAALRAELQLSRDLSVVGDDKIAAARELRRQYIGALAAEQAALSASATGATKKLAEQAQRAGQVADRVIALENQLDALVDRGANEMKLSIARERTNIASMKAELEQSEAETRDIGGTELGGSFAAVKEKFYDIVVRSDVGTIDVAWAHKENADDDVKRLTLQRARELKQLKDEFEDILVKGVPAPGASPPVLQSPTNDVPPTGSPDSGTPNRVAPGAPTTPTAPTVKPGAPTTTGSR